MSTKRSTAPATQPHPGRSTACGPCPADFRWHDLDQQAAQAAWAYLITWTTWLIERFGLHAELPTCWAHHGSLVEDLSTLCLAYDAAYDTTADRGAPMRWRHDLENIREAWSEHNVATCLTDHDAADPADIRRWSEPAWMAAAADTAGRQKGRPIADSTPVRAA